MQHGVEPKCEILIKLGSHLAVRRLHLGPKSLLSTMITRLVDDEAKVCTALTELAVSRVQRAWAALRKVGAKRGTTV